jgi:molybdopterin-guanine dinucleotide biosynthesis protein A
LLSAVILAGSRPGEDPVAMSEGVSSKVLVDIGGTTALDRVIDAVFAAGIGQIVVAGASGEVSQAALARGAEVLAPGPGPIDSVLRALDWFGPPLLVVTADHPLLRNGSASWLPRRRLMRTSPRCSLRARRWRRRSRAANAPG